MYLFVVKFLEPIKIIFFIISVHIFHKLLIQIQCQVDCRLVHIIRVFINSFLQVFCFFVTVMSQSKSVRIIGFVDGDSNELDFFEADLNRMFDHSCLKDRVISVISIVGAFRTGKSFLLDFFLRYLYANVSSWIFGFDLI